MKPIIKVENIAKQYRIGASQASYQTLRDTIADAVRSPLRRRRRRGGAKADETVWALSDVSFEVLPGEVVGIIGRNGAGKSTVLKILSRITEPTKGRVELYGRVASLLEVGTGFHPELTGRENVFLNGAILGMRRAEIAAKFDEIVAFAEIEKFIDTPVKRYSSGMYLRLAFAVAAHLDPDILIVDEVLAVGDAGFQRKCLNKMQDVRQQGRTVLFVSHNMAAVTRLCRRAILLDEGRVLRDGSSHQVVSAYLGSGLGTTSERRWVDPAQSPGNEKARLSAVRVRTEDGQITDAADIRRPVGVEMEFEVLVPGLVLVPNYHFYNEEGVYVFHSSDQDPAWDRRARPLGRYKSTAWIPGNLLAEGTMIVGVALTTPTPLEVHFYERDVVAFQVIDSMDGDSARGDYAGRIPGVVRPLLQWETEYISLEERVALPEGQGI
jgi:lipopolysaccharide transport system ATP-binding protein